MNSSQLWRILNIEICSIHRKHFIRFFIHYLYGFFLKLFYKVRKVFIFSYKTVWVEKKHAYTTNTQTWKMAFNINEQSEFVSIDKIQVFSWNKHYFTDNYLNYADMNAHHTRKVKNEITIVQWVYHWMKKLCLLFKIIKQNKLIIIGV